MQLKTKEGIAEGQPLSDIQEYNIRLEANTIALYFIGFVILIIFIFLFLYIHYFNVLNNIVAKCL